MTEQTYIDVDETLPHIYRLLGENNYYVIRKDSEYSGMVFYNHHQHEWKSQAFITKDSLYMYIKAHLHAARELLDALKPIDTMGEVVC